MVVVSDYGVSVWVFAYGSVFRCLGVFMVMFGGVDCLWGIAFLSTAKYRITRKAAVVGVWVGGGIGWEHY